MYLSFILLQAETPAGGLGSILGNPLIMIVLMVVILYFLMIRPQRKRQKEIERFRSSLQVGQDVITGSGIYGKIKEIQDNSLMLEIAHGVVIKVDKGSVYADASSAPQQGR